jgi:DNA-binding NarL/FixJ family response regulator
VDTPLLRAKRYVPPPQAKLKVLILLANGSASREIAFRTYLARNTVKVHTRNI